MRKILAVSFLGAASLGGAAPLMVDPFDASFADVVKPGAADYTGPIVSLGQALLGQRRTAAASFTGGPGAEFRISGGGGSLLAQGSGGGSGLMELTYSQNPSGFADLSTAATVSFDVLQNTGALTGNLGFYSGGYAHYSYGIFSIAPGFTGRKTIALSSLAGASLVADHVDSMFLDFNLGTNAALRLDRLSVDPVPEPATFAALALGLGALARRRR